MDKSIPSFKSHKHKFSKTNLTLAKKSKKYQENVLHPENKNEAFSDDSGICPTVSCRQESSNSSIPFSASKETTLWKNASSQTAKHKEKSIGIQSIYLSRSKTTQTKGISKLTNASCQTHMNDIRTPGNNLLHQLTKCSNFEKFASDLASHNQTHKFLKTIQSLINGQMNFNNIAWKAVLDMGYLSSCSSITQMDYDTEWLEFCQVLYHMFGVGVINVLRG